MLSNLLMLRTTLFSLQRNYPRAKVDLTAAPPEERQSNLL